ncbi:MAG: beta-eliminating lyase-related protein [Actinomycetota bacterium]|nr:beta-eliminating lyase-related protein [Actinomycetota bacterium]
MREAMAWAEVGDDVYGEDPTVRALEEHVAGLFGHEAALFVATGVLGNQLALRVLVPPTEELLCDADAHLVTYEGGAAAEYGGISTRTLVSPRGLLDPDVLATQVRPAGYGTTVTRAVAVEQTHNRGGGAVWPLERLERVAAVTRAAGAALHCDGARVRNAHVASGVPLSTYGGLFDTLSVCLSKGLGAPVGSVLVGHGSAWPRRGCCAAAGLHALTHHVERLADDHERALRLATLLADRAPAVVDPATVETNIVSLDLAGAGLEAPGLAQRAREQGVLLSVVGRARARLVLHLDADDTDVDRAAEVVGALLAA